MKTVVPCFVGARGFDSLPFSQAGTSEEAQKLKTSGLDFVVLYLGIASQQIQEACLDAGLMTCGVTLANHFDGQMAVDAAHAMGLLPGTTLFLDVEGHLIYQMDPGDLIVKINTWADTVIHEGYTAGIYLGSPQPLTSTELYDLRVTRYWRAAARVVDRKGQLAEPTCGWCMFQAWPSRNWTGVWVDVDFVYEDFEGRLPPMCSKT